MSYLLIAFGAVFTLLALPAAIMRRVHTGVFVMLICGGTLIAHGALYDRLLQLNSVLIPLYCIAFVWAAAMLIYVLSVPICSSDNADIILVLGCGIEGELPTKTLKNRLNTAYNLAKKNEKALIVLSGGLSKGAKQPEAVVMAWYLEEKQLSKKRFIVESEAANTFENFVFTDIALCEYAAKRDVVVTVSSRSHIRRSQLIAKRVDFCTKFTPAPEPWYLLATNYLREFIAITLLCVTGRLV